MISAGAAGIGRAIAQAFFEAGARIHLCDIAEEALGRAKAELPGIGVHQADVSAEAAVESWFGAALAELGGLDVLVNNAGVAGPTMALEELSLDAWERTMAVNLRSQFLCSRRAIPALRAAGGGSIINLSSVAGRLGYRLRTPYAASKWAVIGLTESLAIELGPDDIRVNAILPGIVESERVEQVATAKAQARGISVEAMKDEILSQVSLKRMVPMADIAAMALFLAGPGGRSLTGQSLSVCAGVRSLS